jgi:hypothetical protein
LPVGLLMSQFRPWTITALTSGLTNLDVSPLKMLPGLWRQFLRQIHIPTLLKFRVSGDAPVASIASFLSHHVHIQHLRISHTNINHQASLASSSRLPLSDLTEISGPSRFVTQILKRLSPPVHLEALTIIPDAGGLSFRSVKRILEHPACHQLQHLSISLPTDAAVSVLAFDVHDVNIEAFSSELRTITLSSDDIVFDDEILVRSCNIPAIFDLHCLHRLAASHGYRCFPGPASLHCMISHVLTTTTRKTVYSNFRNP